MESTTEKILYDIFVPSEWEEPVTIEAGEEGHSLWRTLATLTKVCLHFTVDKLKYGLRPTLPAVASLLNRRLPWQLAISSDGTLLAVLRDEVVEIRSVEEEFEVVESVCQVAKDLRPQWRRMTWNSEGSLLAVAMSYGAVYVFTSGGRKVCQLPARTKPTDSGRGGGSIVHATASLTFIPPQKDTESTSLLAVMYYGGILDTYSLRSQEPPVHLHRFSFSDYYPLGVSAMLYHPRLNVLLLCGDGGNVSGWRLLDGFPHWAPALGQSVEKKPRNYLSGIRSSYTQSSSDVVFAMSLSPSGSLLATIDVSGRLCLWEVPSLRLRKAWEIGDQPTSHETDTIPPFGASASRQNVQSLLLDVSWWSDEALILVNTAGEVTVPSILSLRNLLGDLAEPGGCITPAYNGQFFILECESHTSPMGRYRLPSFSNDSEDSEQKEVEEFSLSKIPSSLLKQVLYFLTDSDRFRPHRWKPKVVKKKYRLACLKSMPPEECYERKMQNEEYGEALALAQQYNLDCDLVYQTQWKTHPISIATIQDYLSKVMRLSWVLQECLRVPDEYDATRELLEYGLVRTSFKKLKGVIEDDEEGEDNEMSAEQEEEEVQGKREIEKELRLWKKLSSEQFSMCQYRHKFLTYLDRLSTYEEILGGPSAADEHFDRKFFEHFRCTNLVKIAVGYARDGDFKALESLFTYHGEVLLPHRLPILSNFPETTRPNVYQCLLPEMSSSGSVETWEQDQHRDIDWVETPTLRKLCSLPDEVHSNLGDFLYEENPEWQKYKSPTSGSILTDWYMERATEIEEFSGQVDNALNLVELGISSGVKGLDVLRHELQTLQTLVYQCDVDSRLNLTRLQHMSNLEILQLMMRESTGEEFMLDFCQRALPFLKRVEKLHKGERKKLLEGYITTVAKNDLAPCVALFQQSKGKGPAAAYEPIVKDTEELMSLALKCIYVCDRSDQLEMADSIVECLPLHTATSSKRFAELHKQVDKVEDYLSALDKLQNYGVHQPIHYIRSIQDSKGEAEQLMRKLTRVAGRQQPPLDELGWRNLLQHLLTLRSRVFTCVDQPTCYKIFTESLLCSGREANIHLASQVLTLTPSLSHSTKQLGEEQRFSQGFTYCLPCEPSIQLVLNAAQEYFNSASGFMDKDMDLARLCLDLFEEVPPAIQSELNLIASLSLLDDFGVSILPVQVRLCENKLDIIRNVLDASHSAYKQHEKIFHLARLLGLNKGSETNLREEGVVSSRISDGHGHTVILVALTALEKQDYKLTHYLCSQLMNAKFPAAWEVCRKLAMQDQFKDLDSKMVLLNFALTHCPPEEIQLILKERSVIEVEILYLKCQSGVQGGGGVSGSVVTGGLVGRGVQQIMSRGAGAVQQLMGQRVATEQFTSKSPKQIVCECVSGLQSASVNYEGKETVSLSLSYHPFYSALLEPQKAAEYTPEGPPDYASFKSASMRFQLVLNQALLRAMQVAHTLSDEDTQQDYDSVLLRLAEECCQTDTQLMLGYLFSLPQPQDIQKLLSKIVPYKFSLQLSIYCVCLQLYALSSSSQETHTTSHPYLHPPSDLVDHVTSSSKSDWPERCHLLAEILEQYRELLADHTQAEILQGLGLGIDVQRFTQDSEYKHNTILNLARTSDDNVFTTSLSLARRHGIPEWEVYMQLLDWLLTASRLGIQEMQQKIREVKLIDVLLQSPQQTVDALRSGTFPNLSGRKYGVLILYYSLLQQCNEHGAQVQEPVEIDTHLKLLKKFKSAVPGLDYKLLMTGEDPLSILVPALSSTNVHVIAKLANKVPCKEAGFLCPGMVFCAYAEKLFWEGDGKHPHPQSTTDWLHRYEACYEYLNRLTPDEFHQFVKNIALSRKALQLDLHTRLELVKRAGKFSRQKMKPTSEPSSTSPEQIAQQLEGYFKHLQNLEGLQSTIPPGVAEEEWRQFVTEFDLSLAVPETIHSLATRMVEKGLPLTAVGTILSLAKSVHSHKFTVRGIVQGALMSNLEVVSQNMENMTKLENIVSSVTQLESGGGDVVSSGDVLEVLRPYCSESCHPTNTRKALLQLMEKYLQLSEEDTQLLLLYQTQTVLTEHFSRQVNVEEVSSVDAQKTLFDTLLGDSVSLDQLLALASLLEAWSGSRSPLQKCWIDLLYALANKPKGVVHVVIFRAGLSQVPLEVDERLYSLLSTSNILEAVKLALVSSASELTTKALGELKQQGALQISCDAALFELIILKEQVSAIVNTPVYPPLCEYLKNPPRFSIQNTRLFARLLCCSEDDVSEKLALENPAQRVKQVTTQLHDAGLRMEAGSLVLSAQLFHPALATMNGALAYIADRLFRH